MKPGLLSSVFSFGHLNASAPAPRAEDEEKKEGAGDNEKKEGAEEDKEKEGKSESEGDDEGSDDENKEPSTEAKAAFRRGAASERRRIGQILAAPEAGNNPALAAHLACTTGLSVEAVVGTLKAAPVTPKGGALAAAMAATPTPRVGTDGGKSPAAEIDAGWNRAAEKVNARTSQVFTNKR